MNQVPVEVRETVGQILSAIKIQKVISIDDFYTSANSHYEDAVALFQVARSNRDKEYSALIPRSILDEDENIWTRRLESYWSEIELNGRLAILDELAVATGYKGLSSDVRDLSLLKSFIPEDLFVALSPDEWERRREDIIASANESFRILCLFDQNLSMANLSENAGITLLQQTLDEQDEDGNVICGLLTQTLRRDAEITGARAFATRFNLRLDQFLPLSKDRLRDGLMDFADGLKMIVLNYARERLSKQVKSLAEQADEEAQEQMNDIDVYDFEHVVIHSSEQEGAWEPDTLFRLFDLLRYRAFRVQALAPERRTAIYMVIESMRTIRNIPTSQLQRRIPSDHIHTIRRIELFDDADLLNPAHQPIDLGDIFKVGPEKYFVLLAQPCDLMIRSDGERGIELASLIWVKTLEPEEEVPQEISSFRLDHFEVEPDQRTFIKFRKSIQIALSVLDLSVFNEDGQCRISLSEASIENYPTLHLPWRKRFEKLKGHYQTANTEFNRVYFNPNVSDYQKKALRKLLTCSNRDISLHYTDGVFEFDIRRVARLRNPLSIELLGAYSSYLSRNPREYDFARVGDMP